MKWFAGVKTVEGLRKSYRELLKQHHPDNGGRLEDMQEINREYDRIFDDLRRSTGGEGRTSNEQENTENEMFKSIMEQIAHINADVEIIGTWVWVHGGYEYRELLKSIGFRFAPKKKAWAWHYGEYRVYTRKDIPLGIIREKYGSQKVKEYSHQYLLNEQ